MQLMEFKLAPTASILSPHLINQNLSPTCGLLLAALLQSVMQMALTAIPRSFATSTRWSPAQTASGLPTSLPEVFMRKLAPLVNSVREPMHSWLGPWKDSVPPPTQQPGSQQEHVNGLATKRPPQVPAALMFGKVVLPTPKVPRCQTPREWCGHARRVKRLIAACIHQLLEPLPLVPTGMQQQVVLVLSLPLYLPLSAGAPAT